MYICVRGGGRVCVCTSFQSVQILFSWSDRPIVSSKKRTFIIYSSSRYCWTKAIFLLCVWWTLLNCSYLVSVSTHSRKNCFESSCVEKDEADRCRIYTNFCIEMPVLVILVKKWKQNMFFTSCAMWTFLGII